MLITNDPMIWVGALATLAVFSFLYQDNPAWKVTEHAYVGLTAAYTIGQQFHNFIKPTVMDRIIGDGYWSYVIPALIGLAIYTRYSASLNWVSRYPLSLWVGYGAGMVLAYRPAVLFGQITGTFRVFDGADNILFWICCVTTLMYFFFTISRENPVVNYGASIGRWAIMVALGTAFGNTAIYRFNLLLQRINYLFFEWLQIGL